MAGISYSELYEGYFNATAFQFLLEYNTKKVNQNEGGLELTGTGHLLVLLILDGNINTINRNSTIRP
jgi:hypothetical protein